MDNFKYELIGTNKTIAQLNLLGNVFSRKVVMRTLSKAAQIYIREIRKNIASHRKTGNLHKSIGIIRGSKRFAPALIVAVKMGRKRKYDGYYGYFLEKGTKYIDPIHFFKNAINSKTKSVSDNINGLLKKELDRFIRNKK